MSMIRIAVAAVVLLSLSVPASVVAEDDCQLALVRLHVAQLESPVVMTDAIASSLLDVINLCGTAQAEPVGHGGGPVTKLVCAPGSAAGLGPFTVSISAPPLIGVAPYTEIAPMTYTLDAAGGELFTARGSSGMGFDAATLYGLAYVYGTPIPATEWGVAGSCAKNRHSPCEAMGFVAVYGAFVEVWMYGYFDACAQ